jgi:hypothetical protein
LAAHRTSTTAGRRGHGWRRSETIEHYYKAVDAFLRRHVIFT